MKNKSAGSKLLHFVSLTDSFPYAKSDSCKTIETSLFNVNRDSLPGPLRKQKTKEYIKFLAQKVVAVALAI